MPTDWKQVSKTLKRCMPCNSGGSTCIVQDSNKDGRDYRRLSDLFGHSCQHTYKAYRVNWSINHDHWSTEKLISDHRICGTNVRKDHMSMRREPDPCFNVDIFVLICSLGHKPLQSTFYWQNLNRCSWPNMWSLKCVLRSLSKRQKSFKTIMKYLWLCKFLIRKFGGNVDGPRFLKM